jgi:hypothetical protein
MINWNIYKFALLSRKANFVTCGIKVYAVIRGPALS